MTELSDSDLRERVRALAGVAPPERIEVKTDTSAVLAIRRGAVLRLEGEDFFVLGDVMEPRFGLEDQPKSWVKNAVGRLRWIDFDLAQAFSVHPELAEILLHFAVDTHASYDSVRTMIDDLDRALAAWPARG